MFCAARLSSAEAETGSGHVTSVVKLTWPPCVGLYFCWYSLEADACASNTLWPHLQQHDSRMKRNLALAAVLKRHLERQRLQHSSALLADYYKLCL
jgi:hypothetical protein